jgi:hypothetical protein
VSQILNAIFPGSFVADHQDMSGTIFLNTNSSDNDKNILLGNLSLFPRPAGVSFNVEEFGVFGFNETDATFDHGPFAE